jgi:gliding-associated putative ABC transporter substrate-binding component GldG
MVTTMTTPSSTRKQTLTRVGIIFIILVLLNFVSVRLFGRLDFTKQKLFTLSEASKSLVGSLDDRVTIKAYFTDDLPAPYNNNRRALLDQLNEYKAYAKGNLQYEFISPTGEKGEQEAQQQGIPPIQVNTIKEDKVELIRGYMGLVFLYEDKKEVIPVLQNPSTLEYDISGTIKRLTSRSHKKIGFLGGQGEPGLNEFNGLQQLVGKQYELTAVDVSKGEAIPADVAALIIMAPNTKFSERAKYEIDQYIMRGGRVAFLLNKVDANLQQRFARPLELNLEDLLETYGLRINPDLVRDAQCANITIRQEQFGFQIQSQVPFPYLPVVGKFSAGNMMVKDLKSVILFFASSVDTTQLAPKGLHAEVLMASSDQSGRQSGFIMLDPLQRFAQTDFGEKGIPLAILVTGKFSSAFAGKPVPADTGSVVAPAQGATLTSSPETRVVLVGDGDIARDQYARGSPDNLTFTANMIDFLVDDAGLISIRSKDVSLPPLDQVSDGTKQFIKYGNLVLPPLLVLAFGFIRWQMRKTRRRALGMQ